MKVSIIIAVYNIERYIEKCLVSVLNQTFSEIEIIIVNDGSTDNSLNVIKKICLQDIRVKIINQDNKGLIETRKVGFREAKGEYILFIDGDDWLELETIEKLLNIAESTNSDIVLYNGFISYDNERFLFNTFNLEYSDEIKKDPLKHLLLDNILPGIVFKFIRREYLISNNIELPCDINYAEDLATVSNIFMYKPKIELLEEKFYNYYQRSDSIINSIDSKILDVDRALSFIEQNLKEKNIYLSYKCEFDKLVYRHLLLSKILRSDEIYANRKDIYKQYKARKININKNKYIKKELQYGNANLRLRIKLYNYSYYLGYFYDYIRKIVLRYI